MMLGSVLEFITQAASSSAFIFCFCNLIIVIILVDLKPSFSIHQQSEIHLLKGANDQKQGANNSKPVVEKDTAPMPQAVEVEEVSHDHESETVKNIEIEGNDDCSNEDEEKVEQEKEDDRSEKDDSNDELRKRVEEFIQKVNKGWKEELLSTSSLV
ncbi:nuclear polyadenylated RNA-binding protein 3-like [Vigna radiata var. radiata]|uniref:Nuclear polyadenylated RNA-binding protein 3-like n=1 Tax=Vigna radiata var. radiata TaxID=3916 RepID=A0A3Q0F8D2_VIGRR|nr:nuclear polyadenylated RNA-binding protein 3-like [Vigna radiata var. radiata]